MDNRTIFTKTAKGLGESIGKTKALSRESRKVIVEVNGVAAFKDLLSKLDGFSVDKLTEILTKLKDGDYIREFNPPPVTGEDQTRMPVEAKLDDALTALTMGAFLRELTPPAQNAQSLDFTENMPVFAKTEIDFRQRNDTIMRGEVIAKKKTVESTSQPKQDPRLAQEVTDKKSRETEIKVKKEADEVARKLEKRKKEKEAEDKAWQKFEAKAKEEAETLARKKLEEDAVKSITEMQEHEAQLANEERLRIGAEEQAKKIEEEKVRQAEIEEIEEEKRNTREAADVALKLAAAQKQKDAEDKAWRKFEEKAKKEAEEKLQRELEKIAEEFARQAIEEQAKKDFEEKQKQEAEETARQEAVLQAQKEADTIAQREAQRVAEELAQREAQMLAEEKVRRELQSRLDKEAEENARRDLEISNKKEAAARARQKTEQKKIELAEEQAQRDVAEKLRLAAESHFRQEEQARLQAEESANLVIQERIEREADTARTMIDSDAGMVQPPSGEVERQARLLAENHRKQELDLQAKKAADDIVEKLEEITNEKISEEANALELATQKAQEQVRLSEIAQEREKTRQDAIALTQARREEKNQAKLEQKKQRESDRRARRSSQKVATTSKLNFYDTSRGWGVSIIGTCFVVILVLFVWTQLSSFDEKIALFEKTASQQFQQPMKINKLRFSLLPHPQWQLENVVIGAQGQIKVQQINALVNLSSLFGESMLFKSVELQSPVIDEEGLRWLLFGQAKKQGFEVEHVTASNVKIDSSNLDLGVFDLDAKIGLSKPWKTINLVSSNKDLNIELLIKDEKVQLKLNSKSFALPFGSSLTLSSFSAEGDISPYALTLSKFYGVVYDGILTGNAKLSWEKDWILKGDIKAKQIDVVKWMPELFEEGQTEGDGKFHMQARETKKLFSSQRMNGKFSVQNGTIRGMDVIKLMQGDSSGTSSFKDLSGGFSYDMGRTRLRNVRMAAGLVSANGYVDVNNNQEMEGRFWVDVTTPVRNLRVDLLVSGDLKKPKFSTSSTTVKVQE